jgi:hypothetical protein
LLGRLVDGADEKERCRQHLLGGSAAGPGPGRVVISDPSCAAMRAAVARRSPVCTTICTRACHAISSAGTGVPVDEPGPFRGLCVGPEAERARWPSSGLVRPGGGHDVGLLGGLLQDAVIGAPNDQRWPVSMETAPLH